MRISIITQCLLLLMSCALNSLAACSGESAAEALSPNNAQIIPGEDLVVAEARELPKSRNLVMRNSGSLVLRFDNGTSETLTNSANCENHETCWDYSYRGLVANEQFFLVEVTYYEGSQLMLIARKNGQHYDIEAEPYISPDMKFITVASGCDAYCDSGVQLWEINDGLLMERFSFRPNDYQLFTFKSWSGSSKVEIVKETWTQDICADTLTQHPVELVLVNDDWVLQDQPLPAKPHCLE